MLSTINEIKIIQIKKKISFFLKNSLKKEIFFLAEIEELTKSLGYMCCCSIDGYSSL